MRSLAAFLCLVVATGLRRDERTAWLAESWELGYQYSLPTGPDGLSEAERYQAWYDAQDGGA